MAEEQQGQAEWIQYSEEEWKEWREKQERRWADMESYQSRQNEMNEQIESLRESDKKKKPHQHSWAVEQEHLWLTRQSMDVTERVQRLEDNMREDQVEKLSGRS
eukprot:2887638-Alexandrium_andersonii.AAC.1